MSGKAGQLSTSAWIESSQRAPFIWFAGLWIKQTLAESIHIVWSKTNPDLKEFWIIFEVRNDLCSSSSPVVGSLGRGHCWEQLYGGRPPAPGPHWTSWFWKLFLALCFLLHTFPQGHSKAECPACSHLNIYPQAQGISLNWLLLCGCTIANQGWL